MEFLKTIKRRSFLNELIYVVLNIALAIALMLIIQTTGSIWLALALVALSLWRVFAVRPRFWVAHIRANLVNAIVSVSYVVFLYSAGSTSTDDSSVAILRIIWALLYIGWLLLLKPQSKRVYIVTQAAVALFTGLTAIFIVSYNWPVFAVVLLTWVVGYSTASHVLGSYEDEAHFTLLSLIWGLMIAEVSWLGYHWAVAYRLPFITTILVPQVSIVALCLGFIGYKSYDSFARHEKIRLNDVLLPVIFSVAIIIVLMLAFNSVNIGNNI